MSTTPTDVDAAFAAVADRRRAEAEYDEARRALWRTHHWPHRYDRCAVVAGRRVCRRCLWFHSISLVVAAAGFVGVSPWPPSWDGVLVWVLSVPATVEFVGGELGVWRYSARRQVVVTALLAPAVGRGYHAELTERWSWTFWGPVLVFGTTWFIAAVIAWRRGHGQYRPDPLERTEMESVGS